MQLVTMRISFTAFIINGSCPCWLVAEYKPVTAVLLWSGKLLLALPAQSFLLLGLAGLMTIYFFQMTLE
jgi:hypothetical protein